jgi:hypothetical protein
MSSGGIACKVFATTSNAIANSCPQGVGEPVEKSLDRWFRDKREDSPIGILIAP